MTKTNPFQKSAKRSGKPGKRNLRELNGETNPSKSIPTASSDLTQQPSKKPNPFSQKSRNKMPVTPHKRMTRQPFGPTGAGKEKLSARLKAPTATHSTSMNGYKLGDLVRFTWQHDPAYGKGTASFKGYITKFDGDWIEARDSEEVILHVPISFVKMKRVG